MIDLREEYSNYIMQGNHLAILPISRVHLEWDEVRFTEGVRVYPPSTLDLSKLNFMPNSFDTTSLAEYSSSAARVDLRTLQQHPLIVLPCQFEWNEFRRDGYRGHLRFIATLSNHLDRVFLDIARYQLCDFWPIDSLPGKAGSLNTDPMIATALLYNSATNESRIIAGSVFTHAVVKGLGLPLEPIDGIHFPKNGEVGKIVRQALSLYTNILEASNDTSRFIQSLSLLEFLAYPNDFECFKKVRKIVAKYVAMSKSDLLRIKERFLDLTGKKDSNNKPIGYRTRIVHIGDKIEDIVHTDEELHELFVEMHSYIKSMIDHMIEFSHLSFDDYIQIRQRLGMFAN